MDFLERYSRQIMLPEMGIEAQEKLSRARLLIVGVGGLGSPVALYLTASGVGHIGLVDADTVSESNLQRQVLYATDEVGQSKVLCARRRLLQLSPHTRIDTYAERLTEENARDIIARYDMVIDGCDNAATRYLIDEVCAEQGKPYVYGAIAEYTGQVSLFCTSGGLRYAELFPDRDYILSQPSVERGVVGAIAGIIGSVQAAEAIKFITGVGEPLIRRLFTFDMRTMQSEILLFEK